jgi:hypothetical protein
MSVAVLAPGVPPTRAAAPVRVLQLNLCNSGFAGCYAGGRAVPEAAALVEAVHPDMLTLNEVCRGDVQRALLGAMERAWPGEWVFAAFHPAWDRRRDGPLRCVNGDQYGVAVLGHTARVDWAGVAVRGGIYPVQDPGSPEERGWVCASAAAYTACTTHLAAGSAAVALAQCRYLLGTAAGDGTPTVLGGDLNLTDGGRPGVGDCVPPGWQHTGDGAVQHVLGTGGATLDRTRTVHMAHTDHDACLVTVHIGRPSAAP